MNATAARLRPITASQLTPHRSGVVYGVLAVGLLVRSKSMTWGDCDTVAAVSQGHAPFAVFNRTANPVVRAVLSSPLHPLFSRGLALITITGRRSGRRYTFPVGYRQDGDRVTVNVGSPGRKRWWRNLRDEDQVEMRLRGRRRAGRAQAHGDERTGVTVEVHLDPDPGR